MSFQVRPVFEYAKALNWFPGHMSKGLLEIKRRCKTNVDIILEVRDARIPISSINKQLDSVIRGKPRIVIYNKRDLANQSNEPKIQSLIRQSQGHECIFTTATKGSSPVKSILSLVSDLINKGHYSAEGTRLMVVGMPNVGKSSLINALRRVGVRKGNAVLTGAKPGVTRALSSQVKISENPLIYLLDSPGIMVPFVSDPSQSMRLAVTGGIRDEIADIGFMADYVLWNLNRNGNFSYTDIYKMNEPTDSIHEFLECVAKRIGALLKGGETNIDVAASDILQKYRNGKFGAMTLDGISEESLAKVTKSESLVSKRQQKLLSRKKS